MNKGKHKKFTPKLLSLRNVELQFQHKRHERYGDQAPFFNGCKQKVIDKVDLDLAPGQTLGLVGKSGCGKSSLALGAMGLLPKRSLWRCSKAQFCGKDLPSQNHADWREIRGTGMAMIFQNPMSALTPHLSIGDQTCEGPMHHLGLSKRDATSLIEHWLTKVHIPNPQQVMKSYPHQCSGGMCQRIMIAMTLCMKPSLLIADEPTTALDVKSQAAILTLLSELQQEQNTAMIIVSHDIAVIQERCRDIAVMLDGKIVEQGNTYDVINRPSHPYTQKLIQAQPQIKSSNNNPFIKHTDETPALPSQKTSAFFELKNVSVSYPKAKTWWGAEQQIIVHNIDLQLSQGEIHGLVGDSGCGKSTLCRAIAGLIPLHQGEKQLSGKTFTTHHHEIQMIFQDPLGSLNPRLTILDNLREPITNLKRSWSAKKCRDRINMLIEDVGLEVNHLSRYPHEFSGGQCQRIGIARALAPEPKLILCDEVVSALDVLVQSQIIDLLKKLANDLNMSLLFITHDLAVLQSICERVSVMERGRIVESGLTEHVIHTPQHEATVNLLKAVPKMNRQSQLS